MDGRACPVVAAGSGEELAGLHRHDLPGHAVWVRRCVGCSECDLRSFWPRPGSVDGRGWRCPGCDNAGFSPFEVWLPDHL